MLRYAKYDKFTCRMYLSSTKATNFKQMLSSENSSVEPVFLLLRIRTVPSSSFVPDFAYHGLNYSWLLSSHEGKYRSSVSVLEQCLSPGAVSQYRSSF